MIGKEIYFNSRHKSEQVEVYGYRIDFLPQNLKRICEYDLLVIFFYSVFKVKLLYPHEK